jgi:hypothetical protein
MRPENLPQPYLWEVHREKLDQNNPYNLVDRAEQMRKLGRANPADEPTAAAPGGAQSAPSAQTARAPAVAAGPPHASQARSAPVPLGLGLTDGELRDLFFLVELSQQRAPATFTRPAAGSPEGMRVSFAWSQSFEDRLRGATAPEGSALLFSVQTKGPASFQPNFTFVQGHLTFTPRPDDASQFGVLQGHAGQLAAEELALGYVVLPRTLDLSKPLDVYWDDHRLAATFRP